jgi:hypothetical protein
VTVETKVTLLTIKDWGLLKAKPVLVDRVVETTSAGRCARLNMYRGIATQVVGMFRGVDGLAKPGNYPSARRLIDDQPRIERLTSDLIKEEDIDLQGFMLKPDMQSMPIDDVAALYARMVLGHTDDATCEQILGEIQRANLRIKSALTCR